MKMFIFTNGDRQNEGIFNHKFDLLVQQMWMSYGATYTIVNLIAKKIIYQTEPKELAIKKKKTMCFVSG